MWDCRMACGDVLAAQAPNSDSKCDCLCIFAVVSRAILVSYKIDWFRYWVEAFSLEMLSIFPYKQESPQMLGPCKNAVSFSLKMWLIWSQTCSWTTANNISIVCWELPKIGPYQFCRVCILQSSTAFHVTYPQWTVGTKCSQPLLNDYCSVLNFTVYNYLV